MKGIAVLQHDHSTEANKLMAYCMLKDIPFKRITIKDELPEGFVPSGSVEWSEQLLGFVSEPDYYPDWLQNHLHRKVWKADKWPLGEKVFIKPADKHKRFNGLVTNGGWKGKKKGPYWCSEVVSFVNEWRYYVADGKVLCGEWYDGQIDEPDAPELNIKIPCGYCGALDFGMTNKGHFALVEAQPPYACGWYGVRQEKIELYYEWLVKGWKYMTK